MSKRVTVSEQALREVIGNALDDYHVDQAPVSVNPVVDPSAAQTDPANVDFVPQTKQELVIAVNSLFDGTPDDEVPLVYKSIRTALQAVAEKSGKGEEMSNGKTEQKSVEEVVRLSVRRMLSEISPKFDTSFSGTDYSDSSADDDEDEDGKPKRAYKSTAIGNMNDVGGSSFEEIAGELGFSVSGAKQAVDKALEKARFIGSIDEDEKEIIVLTAMNDYIKSLAKSGELTASDVQLMKDHPEIVRELDGFREFLHTVIKRARKASGVESPLGESSKRRTSFVMEGTGPDGSTATCRFCKSAVKVYKAPHGIEYLDKHVGPDGHDCVGSQSRVAAAAVTEAKKTTKKPMSLAQKKAAKAKADKAKADKAKADKSKKKD